MLKIIGNRQSGKTTDLLYLSCMNGCRILVPTRERVKQLINQAHTLGITIPTPICVQELISGSHLNNNILIDDTEEVLRILLSQYIKDDIVAITINE